MYTLPPSSQEALSEADALIAWSSYARDARGLLVGRLDRLRVLLAQGDSAQAAPLQAMLTSLLPRARAAGHKRTMLTLQALLLWCQIASGATLAAAVAVEELLPQVLAASTPRDLFSVFSLMAPLHGALRLAEMGVAAGGGRVLETGLVVGGAPRRLAEGVQRAVGKMAALAARFAVLAPRAALLEGVLSRLKGDPAAGLTRLLQGVASAERIGLIFEQAMGYWELRRFAPGGREALRRSLMLYKGQNAAWAVARCLAAQRDPSAWDVDGVVLGPLGGGGYPHDGGPGASSKGESVRPPLDSGGSPHGAGSWMEPEREAVQAGATMSGMRPPPRGKQAGGIGGGGSHEWNHDVGPGSSMRGVARPPLRAQPQTGPPGAEGSHDRGTRPGPGPLPDHFGGGNKVGPAPGL